MGQVTTIPSISELDEKNWISPRKRNELGSPIDSIENSPKMREESKERVDISREILMIQQSSPLNQTLVSKNYRGEKSVILEAVKKRSDALKSAQKYLKKDKVFIKKVVQCNGLALAYASKECQNDKEIVLIATKEYKKALKFASDQLRHDKNFVKQVVQVNGWALEYCEEEFKDDKEIVMAAIDSRPKALYYASNRLKDDAEVILYAISREGMCFLYASARIVENIDYVCIAVRNNPFLIDNLPVEYKNQKKVMKIAIEQNYRNIFAPNLSPEILNDPDILLVALQSEIFNRKMRGLILRGVLEVESLIPKELYLSCEFQKVLTKKRVDVFGDRIMQFSDVIIIC